MPRLDIPGEAYMAVSLKAYRSGARQSGIMHHAASALDDAAIARLARHFVDAGANRSDPLATAALDSALVEAGRQLAMSDAAKPDVAACHGPWPTRRTSLFPTIAGQHEPYVRAQLHRGATASAAAPAAPT